MNDTKDTKGGSNIHMTVAYKMEPGWPIEAKVFAKSMTAMIRALEATDKSTNGKVTTQYYLTGFDLDAGGVAYRLTLMPKGVKPTIISVDQNAPSMLNEQSEPDVHS